MHGLIRQKNTIRIGKPNQFDIILLFYSAIILIYVIGLPVVLRSRLILLLAVILLPDALAFIRKHLRVAVILMSAIALWIPTFSFNKNYSASEVIMSICCVLIAISMAKHDKCDDIYKMYSVGALVFLCVLQLSAGIGVPFLKHVSRNYVSVIGLIFVILFYRKEKIETAPLYPAVIYFVLCTLAVGRGGILTAAFILFMLALGRITTRQFAKRYRFVVCLIILLVCAVAFLMFLQSNMASQLFSNFAERGMKSSRTALWHSYFNEAKLSLRNFFFAPSLDRVINYLDYPHLHNSFFQGYASFGLLFFVFLVCVTIWALITFKKKREYVLLILFGAIVIRASLDQLMYTTFMEPFFYYFLVKAMIIKERKIDCKPDKYSHFANLEVLSEGK